MLQFKFKLHLTAPIGPSIDSIKSKISSNFDLRPRGIIEDMNLLRPIYTETSAYGHFGRENPDFSWEKTDNL